MRRYGQEEGLLSQQSQTAYLLALMARFLPENQEEQAIQLLVKKIEDNGFRLSTGFVGTGILMGILSQYGRHDMAYHLLTQRENPSWLYSVDQGATTMWERWDSYRKDVGFGDVAMNSFNHYAYGCVGEWMYRYMAGIDTTEEQPGFQMVLLRPNPDTRTWISQGQERITWVKASYQSRRGLIQVRWQWREGVFDYQVTLEEGMEGILIVPELENTQRVWVNGEEISWKPGKKIQVMGGTWTLLIR